ncbi:MAG TPA: hypothetical protein VFD58_20820 [Blastocatellia bacterium]|nr:hypothetical protein [Blastocatellia bacterium]
MRSRLFRMLPVVSLMLTILPGLSAAGGSASPRGKQSDDQKYAGTWTGSYSTVDGNTGALTYILSKDEKGQWRGTVKFTNQDGEQTAEMKSLQIAEGKLKAKIEPPNGEVEVTIEGTFQGEQFEGTYSVLPKGSTDVAEKGTWKVTRKPAGKTQ